MKETLEVADDTSWLSRDTTDFVSGLKFFSLIFRDHLEKVKPELSQCQSYLMLIQPKKLSQSFLKHTAHIYHFQEEKINVNGKRKKDRRKSPLPIKDIKNWKQEKASPAAAHTREGSESSCQSRSGSVPAGALTAGSAWSLRPPGASVSGTHRPCPHFCPGTVRRQRSGPG